MMNFAHGATQLHSARAVGGPRSLMPTRHNICDARIGRVLRAGSAIASSTTCLLARLLAITAAIFALAVLLPSTLSAQPADPPATSSLIVKLASGLSADEQAAVIGRNGGVEVSAIPALRLHVIEAPTDQLDQILANYRADPQAVRADVNPHRQATASPAAPAYP